MGQKSLPKGSFGGQESITVWIWVTLCQLDSVPENNPVCFNAVIQRKPISLRYDTTTDYKLPGRNWIAGTKYEVSLPNNLFGFRVTMLQITYEISQLFESQLATLSLY